MFCLCLSEFWPVGPVFKRFVSLQNFFPAAMLMLQTVSEHRRQQIHFIDLTSTFQMRWNSPQHTHTHFLLHIAVKSFDVWVGVDLLIEASSPLHGGRSPAPTFLSWAEAPPPMFLSWQRPRPSCSPYGQKLRPFGSLPVMFVNLLSLQSNLM